MAAPRRYSQIGLARLGPGANVCSRSDLPVPERGSEGLKSAQRGIPQGNARVARRAVRLPRDGRYIESRNYRDRMVPSRRREWRAVGNSRRGSKVGPDLGSDKTVETGAGGAAPGGSQGGQHPREGLWPNAANGEVIQLVTKFRRKLGVFCVVKRGQENQWLGTGRSAALGALPNRRMRRDVVIIGRYRR